MSCQMKINFSDFFFQWKKGFAGMGGGSCQEHFKQLEFLIDLLYYENRILIGMQKHVGVVS